MRKMVLIAVEAAVWERFERDAKAWSEVSGDWFSATLDLFLRSLKNPVAPAADEIILNNGMGGEDFAPVKLAGGDDDQDIVFR